VKELLIYEGTFDLIFIKKSDKKYSKFFILNNTFILYVKKRYIKDIETTYK